MKKSLLNDITIEITNHCQLHCQHCGIWAEKDRHQMTASLAVKMIRNLLERYRINFISITGGEPFLNRNCGRILKALAYFRERKEITGFGVYSNAAYFEGVRRVLTAYGSQLRGMHMGISIDGGVKTHDLLRGAGAYEKTMRTIQWISENFAKDIVLEFKFTINQLNYKELTDVYQLARRFKARFSPKIMESGVLVYYHRHDMPNASVLATINQDIIDNVQEQVDVLLSENYSGVNREMVEATMVLLSGGRPCIRACETPGRSFFITSRKEIHPCLYLPSGGKLKEDGSLPETLDFIRDKHTKDAAQGKCPGCFSYHGFLKKFNLTYLQPQSGLPFQLR